MGCHAAINYKEKDWRKKLNQALRGEDKDGKKGNGWCDVFFDNGEFTQRIGPGSLQGLIGDSRFHYWFCSRLRLAWSDLVG
jgi:hypothetical protein